MLRSLTHFQGSVVQGETILLHTDIHVDQHHVEHAFISPICVLALFVKNQGQWECDGLYVRLQFDFVDHRVCLYVSTMLFYHWSSAV